MPFYTHSILIHGAIAEYQSATYFTWSGKLVVTIIKIDIAAIIVIKNAVNATSGLPTSIAMCQNKPVATNISAIIPIMKKGFAMLINKLIGIVKVMQSVINSRPSYIYRE